ncbi:MAG: metal-dependent hydrolase [Candidatus Bathyarchaeota archaeon]|nr:metal-dependent hydrolase [Candidatus Bathyarchaeota archaeon]MDH5788469.1 metal-dependent hydrolase [Candidatus Bathyarchaeota archaeon]
MFLPGHLAWGYVLGKVSAKLLGQDTNIPLLFTVSVLPDFDVFISGLAHHGPTHSIIAIILLFIPIFFIYRTKGIPYFAALVQHVIADLPSLGGIMLLWPITSNWFTEVSEFGRAIFTYYSNFMIFDTFLEWIGFLLSLVLLVKHGDIVNLLKPHLSNLVLLFPAGGIFLSLFFYIPIQMVIPSLAFLLIFCLSAFSYVRHYAGWSTKNKH